MNELASSQAALIALVLSCYFASKYIYAKLRFPLFHPIIISVTVVCTYLYLFDIRYDVFMEKVNILEFMLSLSVVALGYQLYEHMEIIKSNATSILIATFIGSIVGVASVVWIADMMGATKEIIASLQPKSVTTPIAIVLSKSTGGIASLTSVSVIIVGIFGGIAAPAILKIFGINNPVASGLSMGAAAHGFGTARALEMGAIEGAVSGLAIAIMGLSTVLVIVITEAILK